MSSYLSLGVAQRMSAPGVLVLGTGGNDAVRSILVELRPNAATYSVTPRGRIGVDPTTGDPALDATDLTTGSPTGGGAITATTSSAVRLFRVAGDGISVALDFTALSAGYVDVLVTTVLG